MGTSANIIAKTGDKYRVIYNNFDGYKDHLGKQLLENYNTDERVQELLDLGDVSVVYRRVKPMESETHNFNHRAEDVTLAYGRDRGEMGIEARVFDNLKDALAEADETHIYTWDGEAWYYTRRNTDIIKL